jgi:hypothetical protein
MCPFIESPTTKVVLAGVPEDAHFARIVFNPTRGTRLDYLDRDTLPPEAEQERDPKLNDMHPNVLGLNVKNLSRATRHELTVPSKGAPLQLAKIVFYDKDRKPIRVQLPPCDGSTVEGQTYCEVLPDAPDFAAVATNVAAASYVSELNHALGALPDNALTRYRRYFAELDKLTHPELLLANVGGWPGFARATGPIQQWVTDIGLLMDLLETRVAGRSQGGTSSYTAPAVAHDDSTVSRVVRKLSTLQLELMRSHFPDPGRRSLDFDAFEEAFSMFANGQLRLQLPSGFWTTQPSSGFFFFFAEFGLMAMEALQARDEVQFRKDRDDWRMLLPVMARTQEVFVKVYAPTRGYKTLANYTAADFKADAVLAHSELHALSSHCNRARAQTEPELVWLSRQVNDHTRDAFDGSRSLP